MKSLISPSANNVEHDDVGSFHRGEEAADIAMSTGSAKGGRVVERWKIEEAHRDERIVDLLIFLKKKYKNMPRAWRAIDRDDNGFLTLHEFCEALRNVGYDRNLRMIYNLLDYNRGGSISYDEFDPVGSAKIEKFKLVLCDLYGPKGLV